MEKSDCDISSGKTRVIIIGGNFAGLSAAKTLAKLNTEDLEVMVIDASASFNWTPNIHELLSGVKQPVDLNLDLKTVYNQFGFTFIQDTVTSLDSDNNKLQLSDGQELTFDACLIACGYQAKRFIDDDIGFYFRCADDVQKILHQIEFCLMRQDHVSINVVGGGFSGVEVVGELLRQPKIKQACDIQVIESSGQLVSNLPDEVSADIVSLCQSQPVQFHFNSRVVSAHQNKIILSSGKVCDSDITIWTTGSSLPDFLQQSKLSHYNGQGIRVNRTLQSQQNPSVFVAGDAAQILTDDSQSIPKQSFHALDSGSLAASNVHNWLNSKKLQEFNPEPRPVLLSFGDLNTYMIMGESVIASPLLAASKEAVYQLNWCKLSSVLPLSVRKSGIVSRLWRSVNQLVVPELRISTPYKIVSRSKVLKYGRLADLRSLQQGIKATLLE